MSTVRGSEGFVSLLITGEMRSGTTLLANFLNAQPNCTVFADFMKGWFNESRKLGLESLSAGLTEREKNVLLSSLVAAGWQFGISPFEDIDRSSFDTWLELYQQALAALDPERTSQVIGIKITRQYEHPPELMEHGVKVLFCIRDPRDVLLSAKNRFSDYNLFKFATHWRDGYRLARRWEVHPCFHVVRFEDLLQDKTRGHAVDRLSSFLGVPLDPVVEALVIRHGGVFVSNTSFGDVKTLFDQSALHRWKAALASPEVVFASVFLQDEIRDLRYEELEVSRADYRPLHRAYLDYAIRSRVKESLLRMYRALLK